MEQDTSNWKLLNQMWEVDERPAFLQNRHTVNKIPFTNLCALHKNFLDSGGKQGAFSRGAAEEKPLTIRYKAKCDNGLTKFHSARFERMPTPDPEVWYGLVPTKRSPVLKNLPLSCSGSEFAVAQQTVELFHDRTKALTLCKFYNGNFNIQSKPKTETTTFTKDGSRKSVDFNWEECTSIDQIKEALINFAAISQQLWPLDYTPISMLRLMNKYKYLYNGPDAKTRREIICKFFEVVSLENTNQARRKMPPICYEKHERILKDLCEKSGFRLEVPTSIPKINDKSGSGNGFGNKGGAFKSGGNGGGAGSTGGNREKRAIHNGNSVCFTFNNGKTCQVMVNNGRACKREGRLFEHVCNYMYKSTGKFCLKEHPRCRHVN